MIGPIACPSSRDALAALPVANAWLDGEAVGLDAAGMRTSTRRGATLALASPSARARIRGRRVRQTTVAGRGAVFFVPPDTFEQSQLIPITWFVSDQRKQLLDLAGGMHRQANLTITARAGAYITSNRNSTISAVLRRANAFCNATPLFSITTLVAVTTAVAGMTGRRGDSQRGARNKEQAKKLLHDDLHTNHWRVSKPIQDTPLKAAGTSGDNLRWRIVPDLSPRFAGRRSRMSAPTKEVL
ncbi:MAG: hypothetical protein QOI34_1778 [Verrucomicrobiota bacterium]